MLTAIRTLGLPMAHKDDSGSGSGRVSADFGFAGSVPSLDPRICGFGYSKYCGFRADS